VTRRPNRALKENRRSVRPGVEALEVRETPSGLGSTVLAHEIAARERTSGVGLERARFAETATTRSPTTAIAQDRLNAHEGSIAHEGSNAQRSSAGGIPPSLVASFVQQLYGPVVVNGTSYPTPQPTPREIRREEFTATFVGKYYVGPPRFTNQSKTIHIYSYGNSTTSNQFSKGRTQILLLPPADPNAKPTFEDPVAGQTIGLATIVPSNFLQTSNFLVLDLTNLPGVSSADPLMLDHGLPSKLAFSFDLGGAGAYSGPIYTTTPPSPLAPFQPNALGAASYSHGVGIVEIKYIPAPHASPASNASQTGEVYVKIEGLINLPGVLNSIYKGIE
jgi:hypothetical protein